MLTLTMLILIPPKPKPPSITLFTETEDSGKYLIMTKQVEWNDTKFNQAWHVPIGGMVGFKYLIIIIELFIL